jgi:hypothetical protein
MSETQNPLLTKIQLPGRTFQLPSRGALYHNDEIQAQNGEIHVHPMTALAEINMKNPDLLFNGKAIEAVLSECIPSVKKPLELFGRDIDAILFFLRLVTYGITHRVKATGMCGQATEFW